MRMKNGIKAIAFCVVLVIFLSHIYSVFSWKDTAGDYYSSMDSFYELDEDLVDVLFLGSSRCYCSINNALLWDEQGISSFSLSISGQDLVGSYHCLVEALKTQTPEVVCLELYGTLFYGYAVESNLFRNTLPYKMSLNAYSVVKNIAEDRTDELLLRWPIVHSRYSELKKEDFATDRPAYIGYHAEFHTRPVNTLCTYSGDEVEKIGEKEEFWLRKIIALAEEKDIELCFFVAPYVSTEAEQKKLNYVESIAYEHDIPVLNMSRMEKELQFNLNVDFIDAAHTNYHGAQKVTSFMGNFLMQNYDLIDRRGQEGYELWEENSIVRRHEFQNELLRVTYDVNSYFEQLSNNKDYTVIVATTSQYQSDALDMEDYFLPLGMEGFSEGTGIWVVENGQVIWESVGTDVFDYMELDGADLAVSCVDGISTIVVDKKEYKKVGNGINIVVYDNILQEIVDSVGFESTRAYEMVR